jgi:hypothetical protein
MAPYIAAIIVLGGALLGITAYMEWIGVMHLFARRSPPRCTECGRIKGLPTVQATSDCWGCRHPHLRHPHHVGHHDTYG